MAASEPATQLWVAPALPGMSGVAQIARAAAIRSFLM